VNRRSPLDERAKLPVLVAGRFEEFEKAVEVLVERADAKIARQTNRVASNTPAERVFSQLKSGAGQEAGVWACGRRIAAWERATRTSRCKASLAKFRIAG